MSYAQTVQYQGTVQVLGSTTILVPLVWPAKDPAQVAVRAIDFSEVSHGRIPMSVSVSTNQGQIVIVQSSLIDTTVFVTITGGIDDTTVSIGVRLYYSDGTDEACQVLLPIVAQISTAPENDLVPVTQTTTTIGLVPGVLGPLPIMAAAGASVSIRGVVQVRNANGPDTASWDVSALIKGWATNSPIVEAADFRAYTADPAVDACQLSFSPGSGSVINIAVVGMAAMTLNWTSNLSWTAV